MSLLEQQQQQDGGAENDNSNPQHHHHHYLRIALLVVLRLLPNTLMSFPGGLLADTADRQRIMVVLDVLGAVVALGYCGAAVLIAHSTSSNSSTSSLALLYVCTAVQESLSGLYEPSRAAILPQLVDAEHYLPKANAASAIAWSLTAAVGSSLGGFLTAQYGAVVCFATDCVLYLVSAWILAVHVQGDFRVAPQQHQRNGDDDDSSQGHDSTRTSDHMGRGRNHPVTMLYQMFEYLTTSPAGPYVLIKGCGSLLFGASDVVYTTFAENNSGGLDSQKLGWMFTAVGVGCLLGPLLVPDNRSYLPTCILSYAVLGVGYGLIGFSDKYWQKCVWSVFRAAGVAVLWVDSTILVQTTTPPHMLGRVSAIDLAFALTGESISAVMAGWLEDLGWTADQVAYLLSGGAFALAVLWALWSKFWHEPRVSLLSKDSERSESALELEPLQL